MPDHPPSIVILTGAGISVESGLDTFRDKNGIWAKVDHRELATPEGFAHNPVKVHDFYNKRRRQLRDTRPNEAHHALARLEGAWRDNFLLVTQNVDDLHESAGSRRLIHMHGELNSALCEACGMRGPWKTDMSTYSQCPHCSIIGRMRPDIVWFGEMPYQMERIYRALGKADLFVAIGTSGNVYPAAQFVEEASAAGARTVEINLDTSDNTQLFDEVIRGPASTTVPAFVDRLLAQA
ncbi:NAD-dependent deacylase [Mesorhizobium australicum]|uniref:NAD-dependent protein deacylase n=1 Tax=Mesorhizobium australicum TaxID=536018 RepID=A0A1X7NUM5_9HYPH|nr:NAD-dependent deacylase [Mesorhizobium australicum]SMH41346.1 NAD-dependent deacetylase [Mesorhizobium australicum]